MKILEVCRSYYPSIGGLEKFVSQRINIYQKLNIEYNILTTNYNTGKINYDFNPSNVTYLKQFSKYNLCPNFKRDMLFDYDIISVNQVGNYLSDVVISTANKLGKKIILTPHMYFHTISHKIVKQIHEKFFLPGLIQRVDKIICFTDYEIEFWQNKSVNKSKLIKIPHYFQSEKNLSFNEVKQGNKFILYLGRNSKNKKIKLLLNAFIKEATLNYDLYLTINENEIDYELREKIKADKRIKLLGYISEEQKLKYLNNCRALILPTNYEAFGIVCFEAASFAKPLLCSDIRVFREILNNKGVIYFDNTQESLGQALIYFNKISEKELKSMGE
ncbi:MAG TPA: glycosyltransferase family 4 protein, partial [Ignavibacteriaceae bacterium]|nr:glycosyltransferase family 4 protein [Ignavibacteriaceae bacterium]